MRLRESRPRRQWWSAGHTVGDNLQQTNALVGNADEWLRDYFGNGVVEAPQVDEVALFAANENTAMALISSLVQNEGFVYFNSAIDQVETEPFDTSYGVKYHFVTTPAGYRLEVMHMTVVRDEVGHSPLHAAHWPTYLSADQDPNHYTYPIVHTSFKLGDEAAYGEVVGEMGRWAQHGQTCRSTYGVFSYWLPFAIPDHVYMKPRVNTRDAA